MKTGFFIFSLYIVVRKKQFLFGEKEEGDESPLQYALRIFCLKSFMQKCFKHFIGFIDFILNI